MNEIVKKWKLLGLLDGIESKENQEHAAAMLEAGAQFLLNEAKHNAKPILSNPNDPLLLISRDYAYDRISTKEIEIALFPVIRRILTETEFYYSLDMRDLVRSLRTAISVFINIKPQLTHIIADSDVEAFFYREFAIKYANKLKKNKGSV